MSEMRVTFVGTGGSTPLAGRGFPATIVQREGTKLLFDCGEGTQRQMAQHGGLVDVDAILLTHYHADHTYGLPPLLGTYSMRGREAPLVVFAPDAGLDRFREWVRSNIKDSRITFPISYVGLGPNRTERLSGGFMIKTARAYHNVKNALSYAVVEYERPGKLDVEKAKSMAITDPRDYRRLKEGEEVQVGEYYVTPGEVLGPPRPGRKVVISGDTRPNDELVKLARDADLLVHECTFAQRDKADAWRKGHSTTIGAVNDAVQAGAKVLALNHVGPKVTKAIMEKEAGGQSYELLTPHDGDTREIKLL